MQINSLLSGRGKMGGALNARVPHPSSGPIPAPGTPPGEDNADCFEASVSLA